MTINHKLFSTFPLRGKVELSVGSVSTPYHIYDGYGVFIGGTANLSAINALLKNEVLHPVTTLDGSALVGMWLLNFTEASLAPHSEFQCSILAHEKQLPPLQDYPFASLEYFVKADHASILCADIWNNTVECVAYNSEHLGLGANLCNSTFKQDGQTLSFDFFAKDELLISGAVHVPKRQSFSDFRVMLRHFGFRTFFSLMTAEYTQVDVINRRSEAIPTNFRASAFTKADKSIATTFSSATDRLTFGNIPFAHIGFLPQVFQYFDGFKFVYLDPQE